MASWTPLAIKIRRRLAQHGQPDGAHQFRQRTGDRPGAGRQSGYRAVRRQGSGGHRARFAQSRPFARNPGGDQTARKPAGPGAIAGLCWLAGLSEEVTDADSTLFPARFCAGHGRSRRGAAVAGAARSSRHARRKKILVAIFQRGAADGLNVVAPYAEKATPSCGPPSRSRAPPSAPTQRRASTWMASSASSSLEPLKPLWDKRHWHRGSHRLARSLALALRRAGFHGIRYARR